MPKFLFYWILFFVILHSPMRAEVIYLDREIDKLNIAKKIDYLSLPLTDSTLMHALSPTNNWKKNDWNTIHFPDEKNPMWFRFTLKNIDSTPYTYYLLFSSPVIDRFEIYFLHNDQWISQQTGDQIIQKNRALFSHIPAFPIILNTNESRTIYVKIKSENQLFFFYLHL